MSHRHSRSSASALDGLCALTGLIASALLIPGRIREAQRKIDQQNARLQLDRQRIEESKLNQQIKDAEVTMRNNKVVIADLDIELKRLLILKLYKEMDLPTRQLYRELGVKGEGFTPPDYSSDPQSEA